MWSCHSDEDEYFTVDQFREKDYITFFLPWFAIDLGFFGMELLFFLTHRRMEFILI